MKTPTQAQFERWTREYKPVAEAVCMTQAFAQLERERVNKYVLPIFESFGFVDEHGRKIETPELLYLCPDDDLCNKFHERLDVAHRAHGFRGEKNKCPAKLAEYFQKDVEHMLVKAGCELFGISVERFWDPAKYNKWLRMLIGACLNATDGDQT
jgi:hypothetical protein